MNDRPKLKVLDLFSGIGGFSLGLERTGGFETVAFCEIEDFPRRVLKKHWPHVPCYEDIRNVTAERLVADGIGQIDLVCGGYPCQPFSTAGNRKGADDDRHLWPEVKRLLASVRPRWGLFENVAGHVSMGLDKVLSDLESEGYSAWPIIIPACAVDVPHRRDRVWILANAKGAGKWGKARNISEPNGGQDGELSFEPYSTSEDVADAKSFYVQGQHNRQRKGEFGGSCWWLPEPCVGRVADGVPRRVDRLRSLGNAVVPQIPEIIGRTILEAEHANS